MNVERWEHMKQLFTSALAVPAEDRDAFLRKSCGQDDALIAELKALLSAHESTPGESIASGSSAGRRANKWEGQRLGPYHVIHRIGSGGMGEVYVAARADDAFKKRVAIKLVQTGIHSEEILKRFRAERQILAALDHPNIAKLLDGGSTDDGVPYFVMDYVEGTPIHQYCDFRKLSIQDRIRLFRDVCMAVHYVHQNLIVHRDLKPNNVLVTADGKPKLLDFGIAKLLKPELFTQPVDATRVEFRLMTPWYASPEQVRGEAVSTASDIYSLGVILYELLTSRFPYNLKTDGSEEIFRAVCEQEPEKPSSKALKLEPAQKAQARSHLSGAQVADLRATVPEKLKRQLSGDLDLIVLKALRKEPQRRYSSAEQLSEDLRRHLEGLPITAHQDSTRYRAGKFVQRHKAAVTAAILVLVSLVAGIVATTWQARVAQSQRALARQQFNDIRKLTTSFLFEFDNAIQNLPGSTPARELLVQRALQYLNKLSAQARGDATLEHELAEAYLKVGDVQGNPYVANLGNIAGAEQSYNKALEISQQLTRSDQQDSIGQEYLARSYKSLGQVLPILGKPSEAVADLRHATSILESLVVRAPHEKELRFQLANSYQVLGDLQGHSGMPNVGDKVGSQASYQKALALYHSIIASDGNDVPARRGAALVEVRLGDLDGSDGHTRDAMASYQGALATFQDLLAADPNSLEDRRRMAFAYQKIGGIEESLNNSKEALQNYLKALALSEAAARSDPNNAQAKMSFAISLRYVGDLLYKMNNRSGAVSNYRKVLEILQGLSTSEPGNVLAASRYSETLIVLGGTLAEGGDMLEARELTSRGLIIASQLATREEATPDELFNYAESFLTCEPTDLRQPRTAVEYAKRAVEKSGGGSDYLDQLAQAYFQSGSAFKAVESEQRALSTLSADSHDRKRFEARLLKYKMAMRLK